MNIDVVLGVPLVTSGIGFTRVFPRKYQLLLGSLKKSRFPFSCLLNVKKAQVLGKTHQGFRFGRSIFRKFPSINVWIWKRKISWLLVGSWLIS